MRYGSLQGLFSRIFSPNINSSGGYELTYYLDYKIPNYVLPLRNIVLSQYLSTSSKVPRPTTVSKIEQAVSCIVNNIVIHTAFGNDKIPITLDNANYSKPLIYNGVVVNRKVSFTYTKSVIDFLQSYGYISLHKGGVSSWGIDLTGSCYPKDTSPSYITLSESFLEDVMPYVDKRKVAINENVIEVKDSHKNTIEKELESYQKWVVSLLQRSNALYRKVAITIGDKEIDVQLKKIYNNDSWDEGGRDYIVGSGIMQGIMLKENRKRILIDGEPTSEIDYCALHPRIAAELSGMRLESDFDPYLPDSTGYTQYGLRTLCKLSLLVCMNAGYSPLAKSGSKGSVENAIKAIRWELYKNNTLQTMIDNGHFPDIINYREVIEKLIERNYYLADWVVEPRGLYLQNLDGKIMDIILDKFNRIGEVIVPFHDSIVTKKSLVSFGKDVMMDAYKSVLGTNYNCMLKVK